MTFRLGSRAALVFAVSATFFAAGCTSIRDHQGYILDDDLATAIQAGVDNRESVQSTLGRPTFVGQFDQRDWYYLSRNTKQLAFAMPRASEQTVLHVRFDQAGNVESVQRTGLELVSRINPSNEETPTLGSKRSLFEELFGNIGAVGQVGRGGQTADNPQ